MSKQITIHSTLPVSRGIKVVLGKDDKGQPKQVVITLNNGDNLVSEAEAAALKENKGFQNMMEARQFSFPNDAVSTEASDTALAEKQQQMETHNAALTTERDEAKQGLDDFLKVIRAKFGLEETAQMDQTKLTSLILNSNEEAAKATNLANILGERNDLLAHFFTELELGNLPPSLTDKVEGFKNNITELVVEHKAEVEAANTATTKAKSDLKKLGDLVATHTSFKGGFKAETLDGLMEALKKGSFNKPKAN